MADSKGKPVGPGNPPEEYRWKKGQPSPNPRGRPRKLNLREKAASLDKFAEMVDRVGSMTVSRSDGPIELREVFIRQLSELALSNTTPIKERVQLLKLLLDIDQEALRILNDATQVQFNNALAYKERWAAQFEQAERLGKPVPASLPHPADIIIADNGRVSIIGPMLPHQQATLLLLLKKRAALIQLFEMFSADLSDPDALKQLKLIRRDLAKVNKAVPPRLWMPVPPLPAPA